MKWLGKWKEPNIQKVHWAAIINISKGRKENDESFKVFPLCDIRYPYHADFSVRFGINHAYGYHIDKIERRPTLVSLLIFTLSLPALYTESQSVGVPEVGSYGCKHSLIYFSISKAVT